jgi:polyhydroxyalkanoate synthase
MPKPFNNPIRRGQTPHPLVDCWAGAVQQAAKQVALSQGMPGPDVDPKIWRRKWFELLGQAADRYLRGPDFLRMLKAHVDSMIAAKHVFDSQPDSQPDSGHWAGRVLGHAGGLELAQDVQAMRQQLKQLQQQFQLTPTTWQPESASVRPKPSVGPPTRTRPVPKKTYSASPSEVVYEQGNLKLLRYLNDSIKFAEPILICFALVNRPYILDLHENRSVVRRLLDRGFDVYLIDWGEPTEADRNLQLEDYVCKRLQQAVNLVCDRAGTSQLNLLGYCMGGTMSTLFTALQPQRVRNLILMATPIGFGADDDDGLLNLWARRDYFDVDGLIDAFGNCPGEFLQFVFQLMKPVQNFAEKQLMYCENQDDPEFLEQFDSLERWANDGIPVAGETFREYVKSLYQQNRLVNGQLYLAGERVRLESIICPLLMLVAEKDHLVPPSSTLALKRYVSSPEMESMSIDAGHIGLAVSSKSHQQFWPQAANWIASHSTPL